MPSENLKSPSLRPQVFGVQNMLFLKLKMYVLFLFNRVISLWNMFMVYCCTLNQSLGNKVLRCAQKKSKFWTCLGSLWFGLLKSQIHTLCSVNDVTEGITHESPMGDSWVIPRKVDKMVWIFVSASYYNAGQDY